MIRRLCLQSVALRIGLKALEMRALVAETRRQSAILRCEGRNWDQIGITRGGAGWNRPLSISNPATR